MARKTGGDGLFSGDTSFRGQSETVGVVLLTAVIVVVVSVAGVFLLADFSSEQEEEADANVEGETAPYSIELSHNGGDTIDPEEVTVFLNGDTEGEYSLQEFSDEDEFSPGNSWEYTPDDPILGEGRLQAFHDPSNSMVTEGLYDIDVTEVNIVVYESDGEADLEFHTESGEMDTLEREDCADAPETVDAVFDEDVMEAVEQELEEEGCDGENFESLAFSTAHGGGAGVSTVLAATTLQTNTFDDEDLPVNVYSAAEIEILDFDVTVSDGEIIAEYSVENTGDIEETREIEFAVTIDGESHDESDWVTLDGGETTSGELRHDISTPETDTLETAVSVDTGDDNLETSNETEPAEFVIDTIDASYEVESERAVIDYEVENVGDVADVVTLEAHGDDETASADTSIDGGESTEDSLELDISEAGTHDLEVTIPDEDEQASDEITVGTATLVPEIAGIDFEGNSLEVDYEVENTGEITDTTTVDGLVDGEERVSDEVTASPTETAEGTFSIDLGEGEETLTVETEDGSDDSAIDITPATFEVELDEVVYNSTAEAATVDYTVENTGEFSDEQTLTANSSGDSATTEYELEPDESVSETLTVDITEAGEQPIEVATEDDSESEDIYPKPADVEIEDLTATYDNSTEQATVSYTLENTGEFETTQTINASSTDGSVSNEHSLEPGEQKEGNETLDITESGTQEIEVTSANESETDTIDPDAASFVVDDLTVDYDSGTEEATASYTLENTGDFEATQTVSASSNSESVSTEHTLEPDTETSGELTVSITEAGTQDIELATTNETSKANISVDEPAFEIDTFDVSYSDSSETATAQYEITNTGEISDTQEVTLDTDPADTGGESTTELTLEPDETVTEIEEPLSVSIDDSDVESLALATEDESETAPLSLEAPTVEVTDFTTDYDESDEEIEVDYTVENTGDLEQTQDIELLVDGTSETTVGETLGPDDEVSGSFEYDVANPGTYDVAVRTDDDESSAETRTIESNFEIDIDSASPSNGEIEVEYSVTNTGNFEQAQDIDLELADRSETDTEEVTLEPAESESGTLTASLGGSSSDDTVTVSSDDDSVSTDVSISSASIDITETDINSQSFDADDSETISVDYKIENTGDVEESSNLELNVGGDQFDTDSIILGPGEDEALTLSGGVSRSDASPDSVQVSVETDHDSDTVESVTIDAEPKIKNPLGGDNKGNSKGVNTAADYNDWYDAFDFEDSDQDRELLYWEFMDGEEVNENWFGIGGETWVGPSEDDVASVANYRGTTGDSSTADWYVNSLSFDWAEEDCGLFCTEYGYDFDIEITAEHIDDPAHKITEGDWSITYRATALDGDPWSDEADGAILDYGNADYDDHPLNDHFIDERTTDNVDDVTLEQDCMGCAGSGDDYFNLNLEIELVDEDGDIREYDHLITPMGEDY